MITDIDLSSTMIDINKKQENIQILKFNLSVWILFVLLEKAHNSKAMTWDPKVFVYKMQNQ